MGYASWRISLPRLGLGLVGILLLTPKDTKYFLQRVLFLFASLSRGVRARLGLSGSIRRPIRVRTHHHVPVGVCLWLWRFGFTSSENFLQDGTRRSCQPVPSAM